MAPADRHPGVCNEGRIRPSFIEAFEGDAINGNYADNEGRIRPSFIEAGWHRRG